MEFYGKQNKKMVLKPDYILELIYSHITAWIEEFSGFLFYSKFIIMRLYFPNITSHHLKISLHFSKWVKYFASIAATHPPVFQP